MPPRSSKPFIHEVKVTIFENGHFWKWSSNFIFVDSYLLYEVSHIGPRISFFEIWDKKNDIEPQKIVFSVWGQIGQLAKILQILFFILKTKYQIENWNARSCEGSYTKGSVWKWALMYHWFSLCDFPKIGNYVRRKT